MRPCFFISALFAGLFPGCSPAPPDASRRFANEAKVEDFRTPFYTEREVDFEYFKNYIDSTKILPFDYRLDGIFFMSMDERNLYVSMGPSLETAKNSPEQAALRKPFLGLTAFDLRSKKLRWRAAYDQADLCTFPVRDSVFSIGYPYLFGDRLIVTKSDWKTGAVCYNMVDAATGKLLRMEGLEKGNYSVLDLQYWLKYDETRHQAERLDVADAHVLWTYELPASTPSFFGQLKVLNEGFLYYSYSNGDAKGFDILDARTGQIVQSISFTYKELQGAELELSGWENGVAYLSARVCGRIKLDGSRQCVRYNLMYDAAKKQVVRRTQYAEGY